MNETRTRRKSLTLAEAEQKLLPRFEKYLKEEEKAAATIEKYMRDIRYFFRFAPGERKLDKSLILEYKEHLSGKYAVTSANSMLASLNSFLRFVGYTDCCVRQFRVQKQIYCPADKDLTRDEYFRLVETAEKIGNKRLSMMLQTICGTGIRVGELKAITLEAVRRGEATVTCKGKTRTVFLPTQLKKKLLRYAAENQIKAGAVFVTRTGKEMNRSNIWREMKSLCAKAGVAMGKVFPHNLRHLFAKVFYHIEHDVAKLADILGHSSIETTRIYMASSGSEHREKIDHMNLVLSRGTWG